MDKKLLIMPGHPRYQPKQLEDYFGYDNLYREVAAVELANLQTLGELKIISPEEMALLTPEVIEAVMAIPTREVDLIERRITKHDIRAWVRKAQEIIDQVLGRWLHVPLTSYDALDTARILQFLKAYRCATRPALKKVVAIFALQVERYADTLQIGRTHGQHALPITVGFWLATILSRMLHNWEMMETFSNCLVGKISGAVGAYNAQIGLQFHERCRLHPCQKSLNHSYEGRVLSKLGLQPAMISSQILPPESLSYFLFAATMLSASFGQLGRDCRQLMRSEISEIMEEFEKDQVGSSTMAHKRNPINFENLEGMWLRTKNEFGKVLDTLISEHQRDLVGSSVARDFPIILINLQNQLNTLLRKNDKGATFLERIIVNEQACKRNFQMSADVVLAEPMYIALQMAGYRGDAHELVNRKLVPVASCEGTSLVEILRKEAKRDPEIEEAFQKIPREVLILLDHAEKYTGAASEQAKKISRHAWTLLKKYGM